MPQHRPVCTCVEILNLGMQIEIEVEALVE